MKWISNPHVVFLYKSLFETLGLLNTLPDVFHEAVKEWVMKKFGRRLTT